MPYAIWHMAYEIWRRHVRASAFNSRQHPNRNAVRAGTGRRHGAGSDQDRDRREASRGIAETGRRSRDEARARHAAAGLGLRAARWGQVAADQVLQRRDALLRQNLLSE